MDQHPSVVWTKEDATFEPSALAVMARSMIAARRALHKTLPSSLIHDPALDLLLNLFVMDAAAHDATAAELAATTTVAPPTAMRWLRALEQFGFVRLSGKAVSLTDQGRVTVSDTLRSVADSQWTLEGTLG